MTVRVWRAGLLPASARQPRLIAAACLRTLRRERFHGKGELNVVFLDRKAMRKMNKRFLGHDYDTDVIAFNYDDPDAFGDVYISAYQTRVQAKELGHPVLREALTLAVHGTLHLLGYDDATPRQRAAMSRRQDAVLEGL